MLIALNIVIRTNLMQLHPLAYSREAERLAKLARLASAELDVRLAAKYRAMAVEMKRRAAQ